MRYERFCHPSTRVVCTLYPWALKVAEVEQETLCAGGVSSGHLGSPTFRLALYVEYSSVDDTREKGTPL